MCRFRSYGVLPGHETIRDAQTDPCSIGCALPQTVGRFSALYDDRDTSQYASPSEADAALVAHLRAGALKPARRSGLTPHPMAPARDPVAGRPLRHSTDAYLATHTMRTTGRRRARAALAVSTQSNVASLASNQNSTREGAKGGASPTVVADMATAIAAVTSAVSVVVDD